MKFTTSFPSSERVRHLMQEKAQFGPFMHSLMISDIQEADSLESLCNSVSTTIRLIKNRSHSFFATERIYFLMSSLAIEIHNALSRIFSVQHSLHGTRSEIEHNFEEVNELVKDWNIGLTSIYKSFYNEMLEQHKFIPTVQLPPLPSQQSLIGLFSDSIPNPLESLPGRIHFTSRFEQIQQKMKNVFTLLDVVEKTFPERQIYLAYPPPPVTNEMVHPVDILLNRISQPIAVMEQTCFDLSEEHEARWEGIMKEIDKVIAAFEDSCCTLINHHIFTHPVHFNPLLHKSPPKEESSVFIVFCRFCHLFERERIRSAFNGYKPSFSRGMEHETQVLISFQLNNINPYRPLDSQTMNIGSLLNMPFSSGIVLRIRQLHSLLLSHLTKAEVVMNAFQWKNDLLSSKIATITSPTFFGEKLEPFFDTFLKRLNSTVPKHEGRLSLISPSVLQVVKTKKHPTLNSYQQQIIPNFSLDLRCLQSELSLFFHLGAQVEDYAEQMQLMKASSVIITRLECCLQIYDASYEILERGFSQSDSAQQSGNFLRTPSQATTTIDLRRSGQPAAQTSSLRHSPKSIKCNNVILVSNKLEQLRSLIKSGIENQTWKSKKTTNPLPTYVEDLEAAVSQLQSLTHSVTLFHSSIVELVESFEDIELSPPLQTPSPNSPSFFNLSSFENVLQHILKEMKDLVNFGIEPALIERWFQPFEARITQILSTRLEEAMRIWLISFCRNLTGFSQTLPPFESDHRRTAFHLAIPPVGIELDLVNNEVTSSLTPLAIRALFCQQIDSINSSFMCLTRPSPYKVPSTQHPHVFLSLQNHLPINVVKEAVRAIIFVSDFVEQTVQQWKTTSQQVVLLSPPTDTHDVLPSILNFNTQSLEDWVNYFDSGCAELKSFDFENNKVSIGVVTISCKKVQDITWIGLNKILRSIDSRLLLELSPVLSSLYTQMLERKDDAVKLSATIKSLKQSSSDPLTEANTALTCLRHLNSLSSKIDTVDQLLVQLESIQTKRHQAKADGYSLSTDGADLVFNDNNLDVSISIQQFRKHLTEIKHQMEMGDSWKRSNLPRLQQLSEQKLNHFQSRVHEIQRQWEQSSILKDELNIASALRTITTQQEQLASLLADGNDIQSVLAGSESLPLDYLTHIQQDMNAMKEKWTYLNEQFAILSDIRTVPLANTSSKQVRDQLEKILSNVTDSPLDIRSLSVTKKLVAMIQEHMTNALFIDEMQGEQMKKRHWDELASILDTDNLRVTSDGLHPTVGELFDACLLTPPTAYLIHQLETSQETEDEYSLASHVGTNSQKKNIVLTKEVLSKAQGEYALECFINQLSDRWKYAQFETKDYNQKCILITGWTNLLTQLNDDIVQLEGMKWSPYHSAFAAEEEEWIGKLSRLLSLLNSWKSVQSKWIELDAVFGSISDELFGKLFSQKNAFKTADQEFVRLSQQNLRRTTSVLTFLSSTPKAEHTLERLLKEFEAVQKTLSQFLEDQRSSFARLYYVGDGDLLEMIGSPTDPTKAQRHLPKLFAGLHLLTCEFDQNAQNPVLKQVMTSFESKQGEHVQLPFTISARGAVTIHSWLKQLEAGMRLALVTSLVPSLQSLQALGETFRKNGSSRKQNGPDEQFINQVMQFFSDYPEQMNIIALGVFWTHMVELGLNTNKLNSNKENEALTQLKTDFMYFLSTITLILRTMTELPPLLRIKLQHFLAELVYYRDETDQLIAEGVKTVNDYRYVSTLRTYFDPTMVQTDPLSAINISILDANLPHSLEYEGCCDRLVHTHLTSVCYTVITQALQNRMGGSPFGPAGTGKTETVKALGVELGRHVLVFNCDEQFDFKSFGRILVGLCECGAWGCFDEFNRLEARILSAVSQQIQTIQNGLRERHEQIRIIDRPVHLHPNIGVFITMNPGYAGRTELPANLKALFRSVAMVVPDKKRIASVMLYSQGFDHGDELSNKIVPLFDSLATQLSKQPHYDFGLRALKSALISSGSVMSMQRNSAQNQDMHSITMEQALLVKCLNETVTPKLSEKDTAIFTRLINTEFSSAQKDSELITIDDEVELNFDDVARQVCHSRFLDGTDHFIEKLHQIYHIQSIHHGFMLVGTTGTGKTCSIQVFAETISEITGTPIRIHVIDAKAMKKEQLYGSMDWTSREWKDGIFTHTLRTIIAEHTETPTWIVFDGDLDPDWVENLNSVLDDNKLLTLPNGERLPLPPSVRIVFEVQNLRQATMATVSRCGIVWFSDGHIPTQSLVHQYFGRLEHVSLYRSSSLVNETYPSSRRDQETEPTTNIQQAVNAYNDVLGLLNSGLQSIDNEICLQKLCVAVCRQYFIGPQSLLEKVLDFVRSKKAECVMSFTPQRVVKMIFHLLMDGIRQLIEFNNDNQMTGLSSETVVTFITNHLAYSVLWGAGGQMPFEMRVILSAHIIAEMNITLPINPNSTLSHSSLIDFYPTLPTGTFQPWASQVVTVDCPLEMVGAPDYVIPTVDTLRHEAVILSLVRQNVPVLLCGPPGSGKTMTLLHVLQRLPNADVVQLSFSSTTSEEMILQTLFRNCSITHASEYDILQPASSTGNAGHSFERSGDARKLIIFCDEINLPLPDKYGTQRVISLLRQIIEHNGFFHPQTQRWVKLHNVLFVAACNPPTDAGRIPLSKKFLSHLPLILVDFPSKSSLIQIYGTLIRTLFAPFPHLASSSDAVTQIVVGIYSQIKQMFTSKIQSHYIYSPRDLTRFIRSLKEFIYPLHSDLEERHGQLITISDHIIPFTAHQMYRLYQDRLVSEDEKRRVEELVMDQIRGGFPYIEDSSIMDSILFSQLESAQAKQITIDSIRKYLVDRLHRFAEEELDVSLVPFDDVINHILRIDSVLKQRMGHLLLVGASGAGKTILTRFVAWNNGMSLHTIHLSNRYTIESFEEDVRRAMIAAGVKGEHVCFLLSEATSLSTAYLERINSFLSCGDIPGLFSGETMIRLIASLRDEAKLNPESSGITASSGDDDVYAWFITRVQMNMHVVLTINPASAEYGSRTATSPALFNRCVIDWFGDWSNASLHTVAYELVKKLEIGPQQLPDDDREMFVDAHEFDMNSEIASAMTEFHHKVEQQNVFLREKKLLENFATPRHFIDFIAQFTTHYTRNKEQIEERQRHLKTGLEQINKAQEKIRILEITLQEKEQTLKENEMLKESQARKLVDERTLIVSKQSEATKLKDELRTQMAIVSKQREEVDLQLKDANELVEKAKKAVNSLTDQQIAFIKSMRAPNDIIKQTIQCLFYLLDGKLLEWPQIIGKMASSAMKSAIINFQNTTLSMNRIQMVQTNFKDILEMDSAKVEYSSQVCACLLVWIKSQMQFAEVNQTVAPMREKLLQLEEKETQTRQRQEHVEQELVELNQKEKQTQSQLESIAIQTETVRTERNSVSEKVTRCKSLVESLSDEKERWSAETTSLVEGANQMVGNCLLAAGFLAYSGFFDDERRRHIENVWREVLNNSYIDFDDFFSPSERLLTGDERAQAISYGLSDDRLSLENAALIQHFRRYPLLVDPSGELTAFVKAQYQHRGLAVTSLFKPDFQKDLESALRFGKPLLISDAERIDPLLNPILNKTFKRIGGRVVVSLGGNEVDVSPSFFLLLSTAIPANSLHLSPDVTSRVVVINSTVTPTSLAARCLARILAMERPEIGVRRAEIAKARGRDTLHLRRLEDELLLNLADPSADLVGDSAVLDKLQRLKSDVTKVNAKLAEQEEAMSELKDAQAMYTPLSQTAAQIYFLTKKLSEMNPLYYFSIRHFFDFLDTALSEEGPSLHTPTPGLLPQPSLEQDPTALVVRMTSITRRFFSLVNQRIGQSLLQSDRITFSASLAHISIQTQLLCMAQPSLVNYFRDADLLTLSKEDLEEISQCWNCMSIDFKVASPNRLLSRPSRQSWSMTPSRRTSMKIQSESLDNTSHSINGQDDDLDNETEGTQMYDADDLLEEDDPDQPEDCLSARQTRAVTKFASVHPLPIESLVVLLKRYSEDRKARRSSSLSQKEQQGCKQWFAWLNLPNLESVVPPTYSVQISQNFIIQQMYRTLLIRLLRPDRFAFSLRSLVSVFFHHDPHFVDSPNTIDLMEVTSTIMDPSVPLLLLSPSGFNSTEQVEFAASEHGISLKSIPMGSSECSTLAQLALSTIGPNPPNAPFKEQWILLSNIHLVTDWVETSLPNLLKNIRQPKTHSVRVFLTADLNSPLPPTILLNSRRVMMEPAPGLRASLSTSLNQTAQTLSPSLPVQRCRLHFFVDWLHAILVERGRYYPVGWKKQYEFTNGDLQTAHTIVDMWMDVVGSVENNTAQLMFNINGQKKTGMTKSILKLSFKQNIKTADIPFEAIKFGLDRIAYGGKVDMGDDHSTFLGILDFLFNPQLFDNTLSAPTPFTLNINHLASSSNGEPTIKPFPIKTNLTLPSLLPEQSYSSLLKWVDTIPHQISPIYLGLPPDVESERSRRNAEAIADNLRVLLEALEDEALSQSHELATSPI